MSTITDHPYQGALDGLYCAYDSGDIEDIDFCTLPRSAHEPDPCAQATRPHEHRGDGRITAWARDWSWRVTVADDGSICSRDVQPVPYTHSPVQVMAFLMSGRDRIERDIRQGGRE